MFSNEQYATGCRQLFSRSQKDVKRRASTIFFWNAIQISRPLTHRISTCGSREIQKTTTITKTSSVRRARGSGEARRGVDTRPPRGFALQIIHHGAQVGFHDAQGHRQQDQGQGPSEAPLVLSDGTDSPLPPPSFLPPPRKTDEASLVSLSRARARSAKNSAAMRTASSATSRASHI